ncbi:MAG TPA: hypothetical protein VF786_07965 [Terriglobales bacterium]
MRLQSLLVCFVLVLTIALLASALVFAQQSGGRSGEFHFILREQAIENHRQFHEMHLSIERLRSMVLPGIADPDARARAAEEITRWDFFVRSMETQFTVPAGATAANVETRLNSAKGQTMCVACHSSGEVPLFPAAAHGFSE